MSRILLLHPSKWGRGITAIWVASHTGVLRRAGHGVDLFDATFFKDWTEDENSFNTENHQYRPTEYQSYITWSSDSVYSRLQDTIDRFRPDIVFWGALSSHIHGEGEYSALQYGYELMQGVKTSARIIASGLQATADPQAILRIYPGLDALITGESEQVLQEIADRQAGGWDPQRIPGLVFRKSNGSISRTPRQELIRDLDAISPYDYGLFADESLWRPYNGQVTRAVDYEMSRGCPFSCAYCMETVIQKYYGFTQALEKGVIADARRYLRHKSAAIIAREMEGLIQARGIELFRCQDTNFLSIPRRTLEALADWMDEKDLAVRLYIETRPEGISPDRIDLLKRLRVDGIGMGIELSAQGFRETQLKRFADQDKIVSAFAILREAGIKRTAYNVIGFPGQDEESIKQTIALNRMLEPDNITVAYYTPFLGTPLQERGVLAGEFSMYESDLDAQLRTKSRNRGISADLLNHYKENFVRLCQTSG